MKGSSLLRSMTGYGRGEAKGDGFSCSVEIKSLNHRYLEVNVRLPDELSRMELELKRAIKIQVKRGAIHVNVNFSYDGAPDLEINDDLFRKLLKLEKEVERRHGISQPLNIHYILSYPGVVKQVYPEIPYKRKREIVMRALEKALENLLKSREKEGENLRKDIIGRLERIARSLSFIELLEHAKEEELVRKMEEEIRQAQQGQGQLVPQGVLPSTSEEIVRLKSHLKTAHLLLRRGGVIGRELDFLAQEMHREINTLSAKALSSKTSRYVVRIKVEIEKIREQALNIE